jgi:hypothetical protein
VNVVSIAAEDVKKIGGEFERSRILRSELEDQLEVLAIGAQTCNRIMGIGLWGKKTVTLLSIWTSHSSLKGIYRVPFMQAQPSEATQELILEPLSEPIEASAPSSTSTINPGEDVVFREAYTFETKGSVSVDDSTLSQEDVEVLSSLRRRDKKKKQKEKIGHAPICLNSG